MSLCKHCGKKIGAGFVFCSTNCAKTFQREIKEVICHKCGKTIKAEEHVHVERRFPNGLTVPPEYRGYIVSEWAICNECWHSLLEEWMCERQGIAVWKTPE